MLAISFVFIDLLMDDPSMYISNEFHIVMFTTLAIIIVGIVIILKRPWYDNVSPIGMIILGCAFLLCSIYVTTTDVPFIEDCKTLSNISDISIHGCMSIVLEKSHTGQEILDIYESTNIEKDISQHEILERNLLP